MTPISIRLIISGVIVLLATFRVSAGPCPRTTTTQDQWARQSIDLLILRARAAYEEESRERDYARALRGIAAALDRCKLSSDAGFTNRFPELVEYIRVLSLDKQSGHELGFEVPDKVYFQETKSFVSIPDFLLTTEFLRAVRRFETLNAAKVLLRAMNATRSPEQQLLFFSYESRHLGTPDNDNSYRRLLIVVPEDAEHKLPEKWVQFGIPDPRARVPVRNVSVVSVVRGPEESTNTYFKDYFRTYRRNGAITVNGRWELGYGDDNCVKCHKSGVLPIFPVAGSVSENEKAVVDSVNKRFLSYGAPRFDRYLDLSKFGPGLGSAKDSHLSRRVQLCSACHQPAGLGSLNWPMDSVLISSFVEGGRMPLGTNLREWESAELYRELIDEYFSVDDSHPGILKAWLSGKRR